MESSVLSVPYPCCRQAVAIRCKTMMREGPVPAPGWDRQRMVAPGRPYAGLERLVGGRRQRLVRNPAADAHAMMSARVDVAVGTGGGGRWSSACIVPMESRASMREALDWLVDRLASGWAIHAALRADKGEAAYLPHGPWPRPGMRPVMAERLHARQEQPDQASRQLDWCASLTARRWRLPLESKSGPSPVGATTLACVVPHLRRARAASSPPVSTRW
jgi:hypothetical protein